MNVEKRKKRIFGAGVLLFMMLLTAFTMVAFATGEDVSTSYSLTIEKIFADGTPENAKEQEYTFRIQGQAKKQDGTVTDTIDKTITLSKKNGWTYTCTAGAPITATVTEVTSGIQVNQGGQHYNMHNTKCVTSALLLGSQKLQLKNDASIKLSKPEKEGEKPLTSSWFHVYNEPYPGHHDVIEKVDEVVELIPGAKEQVFDHLSAGVYTVEELKAPDGYSVLVGPRTANVNAGDEGTFYINGNPGRLTITAGGTPGDGATHYYTVDRQKEADDAANHISFAPRTSLVRSGETWVIDDLPRGSYTVTEHTYAGSCGYTLTVPQSKLIQSRSLKSSALSNTDRRIWKSFNASPEADYIILKSFGPLYDSNGKKLNSTYSHFHYGALENGGISYWTRTGPYDGIYNYLPNNPPDVPLEANQAGNKPVYFSIVNVKSTAAAKIGVEWEEYAYKEPVSTWFGKAFGSTVTKSIDGRGWMLFTKAPDSSQGAENLTYYYTITSGDKKSVANCHVTDADGHALNGRLTTVDDHTVRLAVKPGESVQLNGLKKGTYDIVESVDKDVADGFSMEIVGCAVNVTQANTASRIRVQGPRTLTIGKPGCTDGGGRSRPDLYVQGRRFKRSAGIRYGGSDAPRRTDGHGRSASRKRHLYRRSDQRGRTLPDDLYRQLHGHRPGVRDCRQPERHDHL